MTKKWKVGAVYELVNDQGFLEHIAVNDKLLPYVSDKFKVLEVDDWGDVVSVENVEFSIVSRGSTGVILVSAEREFLNV